MKQQYLSRSLSQLAQTTWHNPSNHVTENNVLKVTARQNACWVLNTPNVKIKLVLFLLTIQF